MEAPSTAEDATFELQLQLRQLQKEVSRLKESEKALRLGLTRSIGGLKAVSDLTTQKDPLLTLPPRYNPAVSALRGKAADLARFRSEQAQQWVLGHSALLREFRQEFPEEFRAAFKGREGDSGAANEEARRLLGAAGVEA